MKEKNKKPTLEIFQNIIKILKENFYKASTKKKNKVLLYLKASVVIFYFITFTFFSVQAQIPIPEGEFENWHLHHQVYMKNQQEVGGLHWIRWYNLVQRYCFKNYRCLLRNICCKAWNQAMGNIMITGLLASGKFINTDPFVVQENHSPIYL